MGDATETRRLWMTGAEKARAAMVERQIAGRGVHDPRVLDAMRSVPREAFVPAELAAFAYEDLPLPIGAGQTISQPYIVALMIEAARVEPQDHVLEIGVGSGYAAAVVGRIARRVFAIDRHAELAEPARERMARLGYDNVVIRTSDGTRGWPENAPFDVILVAAGAPSIPRPLRAQLVIGGRLVIPVGDADQQSLIRIIRKTDDDYQEEDLGWVKFVPLIGRHGWTADTGTDPHMIPLDEASRDT